MTNPFRNDALGKLILRLTVGVLMLFHGIAKILNPGTLDHIVSLLAKMELPPAIAYGVYLGEVVAPLMVIFGIYARIGGALIFGNMAFAIALAHSGDLLALTKHGGWALELQGFYLLCGLAVVFLGSGRMAFKPD